MLKVAWKVAPRNVLIALVSVLAMSLGFVASGSADNPPPGPPSVDPTGAAPLSFPGESATLEAIARHERLLAIGRSPDHKAKRERDASEYIDMDRDDALALDEQRYGGIIGAAPFDPLPLAPDERVLSTPTPYLTRIRDDANNTALVQTMLPTKALDGDRLAMANYHLDATADAYHPGNPLVDTTIYKEFDKGIRFDKQGYSVRLSGASSTDEPRIVDDKAFYGNLVTDTDALVTPTATGVETTLFVRSADAPRESALQFDLDPTEALQYATPVPGGSPAVATGAEITRDGKPIAGIAAPIAVDAEGRTVPVSYRIEGSKMVLELPSCGEAIDCPYAVDPIIDNYAVDQNGTPSPTQTRDPFLYWAGYESYIDPNGAGYTGTNYQHNNDGFWLYRGFNGSANGLYVYAPQKNGTTTRSLANGQFGEWVWRAPGESVISRVVFGGVAFSSYGTCQVQGVL